MAETTIKERIFGLVRAIKDGEPLGTTDQVVAALSEDPIRVRTNLVALGNEGVVEHYGGCWYRLVGQRGPERELDQLIARHEIGADLGTIGEVAGRLRRSGQRVVQALDTKTAEGCLTRATGELAFVHWYATRGRFDWSLPSARQLAIGATALAPGEDFLERLDRAEATRGETGSLDDRVRWFPGAGEGLAWVGIKGGTDGVRWLLAVGRRAPSVAHAERLATRFSANGGVRLPTAEEFPVRRRLPVMTRRLWRAVNAGGGPKSSVELVMSKWANGVDDCEDALPPGVSETEGLLVATFPVEQALVVIGGAEEPGIEERARDWLAAVRTQLRRPDYWPAPQPPYRASPGGGAPE